MTKKYLWYRPNSIENPFTIIDDPAKIYRGAQFDEDNDKLYEIGPEVKMKLVIEPKKEKHTVYRNQSAGITPGYYD